MALNLNFGAYVTGANTMNNSVPVTVASDQTALPIAKLGASNVANTANSIPISFATDIANLPRPVRTQKVVAQLTRNNVNASASFLASQGVGKYADLYGLIIQNSNTTVSTLVNINDGTATYTFNAPISTNPINQWVVPLEGAIPATTANTPWTANTTANVASVTLTGLFVLNTQ